MKPTSSAFRVTGKSSKKEKAEINGILLPYNGSVHDYTSFHSIVLNTIGKFLLFIKCSENDLEYNNEFDTTRLKHFKDLSLGNILLCLSLVYSKCSSNASQIEKWFTLIMLNALDVFGNSDPDINKMISEQLRIFDIEDTELTNSTNYIKGIYEKSKLLYKETINRNITENIKKGKLIYIEQTGFCFIEEYIPNYNNSKCLKISNLGFDYNINDFICDQVYHIAQNRFLHLKIKDE